MTTFGGPWSRLKLDCVESYAVAYLKVMQQQNWSLHYVDAFAGQGRQQLKLANSARRMASSSSKNSTVEG